jgi:hypothetical protein
VDYYRNTKCSNCGKEFICCETKKPDFKEVSTPENYRIEAIRYWGCRSCGYINIRKNYERFDIKKGKMMKKQFLPVML